MKASNKPVPADTKPANPFGFGADFLAAMRQEAKEPSDFQENRWYPEPGDELFGSVIKCESALTKFGECPLLEVQTADQGVLCMFLGGVQLQRWHDGAGGFAVGDIVYIRYEGEEELKNGRTLKRFACTHRTADGEVREPLTANIDGMTDQEFDPFADQ